MKNTGGLEKKQQENELAYSKKYKTERRMEGRGTRDIVKWNQMTTLRFQTGVNQTSPASNIYII